MKRVANILIGALAGVCLSVGLLLQSVLQFVSDADSTATTVTSVLSEPALRNLISEEIVDKVGEENSDPTQRLVFTIARQRLVQLVAQKLDEPIAAELVANIVRGAYRVYVDGENSVSIDLSPFAGFARDAVAAVDVRLKADFADSFQTFEIERPRNAPNVGTLLAVVQIATWALMIVGALLLVILWRASHLQRRTHIEVPLVIGCTGLFISAFVIFARIMAPQFAEENGDVVKILVEHITAPAFSRAMVCCGLALGLGGMQFVRRKKPESLT